MIYISTAQEARKRFPSPLQKNGTWVQQCRICGGSGRVLVNKSGIVGDHRVKRCKACKKGRKR